MKEEILNVLDNTSVNRISADTALVQIMTIIEKYQALQFLQPDVMRCSSKEIDRFFKDTMYTDLTNYYGIIQKTQKGNYVKWRSPSEMIKDFFKWKKNTV
jgi:hypothetical protein